MCFATIACNTTLKLCLNTFATTSNTPCPLVFAFTLHSDLFGCTLLTCNGMKGEFFAGSSLGVSSSSLEVG